MDTIQNTENYVITFNTQFTTYTVFYEDKHSSNLVHNYFYDQVFITISKGVTQMYFLYQILPYFCVPASDTSRHLAYRTQNLFFSRGGRHSCRVYQPFFLFFLLLLTLLVLLSGQCYGQVERSETECKKLKHQMLQIQLASLFLYQLFFSKDI